MSTISADVARGPVDNYLNHSRGIKSWLLTLDHKRIGIMYLIGVLTAFFAGGIFAMLIRTQLLVPNGVIFTGSSKAYEAYNEVFTLHGVIMVFIVLVPSVPAALGNFVLPIMLGAKDVAFPRLNLASFYLWVTGVLCTLTAVLIGNVDTGWTFYTPYSIKSDLLPWHNPVIYVTLGIFILGFSSIFTGMNFIVTVHKLRPPGMTWFRMPLFLWGLYATSIIQVLATPVLGITVLLLAIENTMHIGIFDPMLGGDPVLFQHFFWFYSHPAVYIMVLPAMGIISEVISTFSHKHIFGYRFIALSSIAIAVIGFVVWGHHMFVNGQSTLLDTIFSFLTFVVAIPSAIKVFNWLATLYKGSIELRTPMLYGLTFIWQFTIGGLTGLFLGALSVDVQLHDTYFVVAHFHYVMVGGSIMGFMAGIHYWWPKMFGKMYNETAGRIAWAFVFIGFNLTFFPQFIMGSHGMPRRYAQYGHTPEFQIFHVLSSCGAYLQFIGFFTIAVYLVHSLMRGKKAPANPWGSATLEWVAPSPPPHDNFATTPSVGDPYDLEGLTYNAQIDGYLPAKRVGRPVTTAHH